MNTPSEKTVTKKLMLVLAFGLVSALGLSSGLRADDDEHENERHEGKGRAESIVFGGGVNAQARQIIQVSNAKWKAECTSCHMAYLPGLLPARSWQKMMGSLDQHFGENAELDDPTRAEITRFLVDNAADRVNSRRSAKINQSIAAGSTPLRISETPYFVRKHDEISANVWKRPKIKSAANCVACHQGAERGNFSEHEVSIPR